MPSRLTRSGLLDRALPEPNTGCWIWLAAVDRKGYGRIGSKSLAHRRMYAELVGPIPAGLCLCHHCDTPICVNPDHMFLGTIADNTRDMIRKGRARFQGNGGTARSTVLTEADARLILNSDETGAVLANRYGVAKSTIWMLRAGRNWKHLHRELAANG